MDKLRTFAVASQIRVQHCKLARMTDEQILKEIEIYTPQPPHIMFGGFTKTTPYADDISKSWRWSSKAERGFSIK